MRITLLTDGTRGDLQPFLALGVRLLERGHDVAMTAYGPVADAAEQIGIRVARIPVDLSAHLASPEGQAFLSAGPPQALRAVQAFFAQHAVALDDAMLEAAAGAEAIVGMHATMESSQAIADALEVPHVVAVLMPLWPTDAYESAYSPWVPGRLLRRASHRLIYEVWCRSGADRVRALRRRLELAEKATPAMRRALSAGTLAPCPWSPHLVPTPARWSAARPVTGEWTPPAGLLVDPALPEHVDTWLDSGEAPVFLGFGSMPVLDPHRLLADATAAASALGVRALVQLDGLGDVDLPDHVRTVGAVDHAGVFPRCRAAVHHGAAGTTHAALRAGLPTGIASVAFEQPWWGRQVTARGAGVATTYRRLTESTLTSMLSSILDADRVRRAAEIGARMRSDPDGATSAAELLDDWLVTAEALPVLRAA